MLMLSSEKHQLFVTSHPEADSAAQRPCFPLKYFDIFAFQELDVWTTDFVLPASVWLAGFFNPQSFLTAIMQSMARKNEWPLDKMCLAVEVTKKNREEITAPPREGSYVHGLFMEGKRPRVFRDASDTEKVQLSLNNPCPGRLSEPGSLCTSSGRQRRAAPSRLPAELHKSEAVFGKFRRVS